MAFKDITLPPCMALDLRVTSRLRTESVRALSGDIYSSEKWSTFRAEMRASYAPQTLEEIETTRAFWYNVRSLHSFRVKDPTDYKSCSINDTPADTDQTIGVGDGVATQFQLSKTYTFGAESHTHAIYAPKTGTVLISFDDVSQASGWSVNASTGIITFTVAPTNGVIIKAGFEFDRKMKFEAEDISVQFITPTIGEVTRFTLIENPN